MGTFTMVNDNGHNGKPLYKNTNSQYLYYWSDYSKWFISSDYKSSMRGVTSVATTKCPGMVGPQEVMETSEWTYWNDGAWHQGALLTIACVRKFTFCEC